MRWIVAVALVLIVACGDSDDPDPTSEAGGTTEDVGEMATQTLTKAIAGDWGAVYDELHPAQQAVVNRDLFVSCRVQVTSPPYAVTVTQVGHDAMTAPEIFDRSSWAAVFSLQLEGYETIESRLHVYDENGDLSWYMDKVSIDEFRAGRCDVEPQLASDFALMIANAEIAGDWATVYDGLHPNQQAVVPRELFLECRASDFVQATEVSVYGVITEDFSAPEVPTSESYAVTLKGLLPEQTPALGTLHIFDVGSQYGWVLGEESISAFKAGQCD